MIYLYDSVPPILKGKILYPLNLLKDKFPDAYKEEVSKYQGREILLNKKIPILNCLWNDVLHFSAVPPKEIKQALLNAGHHPNPFICYQIDPQLIDPKNTVIYLYTRKDGELTEEEFLPFNPADLEKYSTMPDPAIAYYRDAKAKHQRPMVFHLIPHILYQGSIDTSNLPIVTT